jgi:hypothetical protein
VCVIDDIAQALHGCGSRCQCEIKHMIYIRTR